MELVGQINVHSLDLIHAVKSSHCGKSLGVNVHIAFETQLPAKDVLLS